MLRDIVKFEKKYEEVEVNTAEKVSEWFAKKNARYDLRPSRVPKVEQATTFSNTCIAGFEIRLLRWGATVQGTSLVDHGHIAISVPLTGTSDVYDTHFGKIVCTGNQARIFHRAAGTRVNSLAGSSMLNFALPIDLLETRARSYYNTELNEPLRFSPVIDFSSAGGVVISDLLGYLVAHTVGDPDALRHPTVESSLRELVISTVFSTLSHNYGQEQSTKTDCGVPRSVKRAEDYMRAHADDPISVETLAREAGCSERALQNAFKTFRGTTPMGALRDIRLEKARQELEEAAGTVTEIAFKWGFSNLGRFAAQYSAKYGERPCETARIDLSQRQVRR